MVAVISISLVWALELHERHGVEIVGSIRRGLPPFTVPWWSGIQKPMQLFQTAGIAVFVSILEAISIAKALAEKHHMRVDPEIELRGKHLPACHI